MDAKNRPNSPYYCVICGRNTNNKKYFVDEWGNYFLSCSNCKKVWCVECMGQLTKLGPRKTYKLAKKGRMECIYCNQFMPIIKLPQNLPFVQESNQFAENLSQVSKTNLEKKFCPLCGHEINANAKYCEYCGGEQ